LGSSTRAGSASPGAVLDRPERAAGDGRVHVALIGPPNSGKSTLFNQLTGLRQKVANYPGVTVEKHVGKVSLPDGGEVRLVDLPGVNGLNARTLDEKVTRDVLDGRAEGLPAPDALVLIVDSTRLEAHLMLLEPLLERGMPTLLVLNMADELEERGGSVRDEVLAEQLGTRVVRTNARSGKGVDQIRAFLQEVAADGPRAAPPERPRPQGKPLPVVDAFANRRQHIREVGRLAEHASPGPSALTERLDSVLLHKVWGPIIFAAVIILVFQSIFTWAIPLMDGVEFLIASSGEWLAARMPDVWLRSLLIDGVWNGVGAVVVFLPQILILFFFLGILEDSGYMARAAVIADRAMVKVGLQGRAFLPLLSGFACAVPAILAARTVEDERDRIATIFVTPFMVCSARLPVYVLLIAAFIPERPILGPFLGARAATMIGLYALGITAAVGTTYLLKRTLLKGPRSDFLMDLPSYRWPSPKSIALRLLDRCRIFLKRAGRIILTVTVVLWVLTQFPRVDGAAPAVEASVLGMMGHFIEPLIEPLGFDWRIGMGLVASLAAREVIVSALGTIYGVQDPTETSIQLQEAITSYLDFGGAIALLVFFAFALQCMSTVAVMRRETAGWKWPALQFGYMLTLAWVGAFVAKLLIG